LSMLKEFLTKQIVTNTSNISIDLFKRFTNESGTHYDINKYYSNKRNFIYAIRLHSSFNKRHIEIPIEESYYNKTITENAEISFSTPECKNSAEDVMEIVELYNDWAKRTMNRQKDVLPILIASKRLVYENKTVGVIINNLNYYFNPSNVFDKLPMLKLYIHPNKINKVLESGTIANVDKNIPINVVYQYNIFGLLVQSFGKAVGLLRNKSIRGEISKIIDTSSKASQITQSIDKILIDQTDKDLLSKIFLSKFKNWDKYYFKFDMDYVESLFPINNHDTTLQNVKIILDKNVVIVPKLKLSGSILNATLCESKEPYCQGKKIMIEKKLYDKLLDILCDQLTIHWKRRKIFQYGMLDTAIFDRLSFERRLNEKIYIYPIIDK
jgi:hypothetical protein